MAIHCHSARYHYDSFHNRGGDIINIGSNNTYNFGGCGFGASIWGNGGNFWGGFGTSLGWGLGQGLMNWLGNGLNGGGWNPAGIFGGYGMGYGMNPWQQMSNFSWGGSTGGGADSSSSIAKKNTDYAKLNKLFDRKNALLAKDNPSLDDLKTLKNDIDAAAKNLDGNDDGNDNDYIKALRFGLDDKIKKLEGGQSGTAPSTTPTTTPSSTTPTTPTGPATTPSKPQSTGDTDSTPAQTTASEPWSGVTSWGDNSLANKNINGDLIQYGYGRVSEDDKITEVKVTREINGTMHNINGNCQLSTEKAKKAGKDSNLPAYIAITSSKSGNTFKYKHVGFTADGNPVYATPASDTNNNVYVLAKKSDSFELIQLKGFRGHRVPDKQNG